MSSHNPPALLPSLDALFSDPDILEIMIDGYTSVYVEKQGRLQDVPSPYQSHEQLVGELVALAEYAGRTLNPESPLLDLRLADGSRVHVVMPPIAVGGPAVNIRKFPNKSFMTFEELVQVGALDENAATFLKACVRSELNIVIAGGTGSGKTTLMNVICGHIPRTERIIAVGAVAELKLTQPRKVTLEGREPNLEGKGEVSVRDLIRSAMKMRPDRILVTDVLGGEVIDILNAINSGITGTIFSVHANGVRDALSRLEIMATAGNPSLPLLTIREQLASALHLIVYIERLLTGDRHLMKIASIQGMQGDSLLVEDIFEFHQTGTANGRAQGYTNPTGRLPRFLNRLRDLNPDLSLDIFNPR